MFIALMWIGGNTQLQSSNPLHGSCNTAVSLRKWWLKTFDCFVFQIEILKFCSDNAFICNTYG